MQFSQDRMRLSHNRNQCSPSDSVGLIFTGLYHTSENQPLEILIVRDAGAVSGGRKKSKWARKKFIPGSPRMREPWS